MKIIFLDVDGVLNYIGANQRLPEGTYFVEDEKLVLLRELVNETGAELVLSSSWRSGWSDFVLSNDYQRISMENSKPYFMLCAKLHDYGLSLLSETPRLPGKSKQEDINYWLKEWPGEKIENYVILDDEQKYFSKENKHLVLISALTGLTEEHIKKVKKVLNISKYKVLLVDDIEINRKVIKALLEPDYLVFEAVNGREALRIIEEDRLIDLVITDIQMPEMDGLELIKKVRENHAYDHIPIIANTQYGDAKQEEEILDLGANDFIYKPTTPKIVKLRVKSVLAVNSWRFTNSEK